MNRRIAKNSKSVDENSKTKIEIQLPHAGRKGSIWNNIQISMEEGWGTITTSAIPYCLSERIPHALFSEEIKEDWF